MSRYIRLILIITVLAQSFFAQSVTRLSFSKPSYMMRIPISSVYKTPYLLRTGMATDIYGFKDTLIAKGVFFETDITNSFKLGLTGIQGITGKRPIELGIHFQQRLITYGDISFSLGIHDLVIRQGEPQISVDPQNLSIFGVISNEKKFENNSLYTYMGLGTGGLATAFRRDTSLGAGIFAGVLIHTNILNERGGVDFIGEFDGGGLNIAVKIPLSFDYNLSLGITNFGYLYNFGEKNFASTPANKRPSFSIGLDFRVPRSRPGYAKKMPGEEVDEKTKLVMELEQKFTAKLDSTIKAADIEISKLRDSLRIYELEIRYMNSQITLLKQRSAAIEDSLRKAKLAKYVIEQNINQSMRHLSNSLKFFYSGDYQQALNEVEKAIVLTPNLALAYARKGSIYYRLGDIEKAVINWNVALKLDPDYEDVRNILQAMAESRLRVIDRSKE